MNSQFAFLCDAANISKNNLFNVLSGGIENFTFRQLPQTRPVSLLIRIEYTSVEESGDHIVEIRLIDSDGKDRMSPARLKVNFPKSGRFFNLMAPLIPRFDEYGPHGVEISVDRHTIASIPLNVIKTI